VTSKYDHLTLKMTSGAIENNTIELSILKNSDIDTEIVSLALLEVTLAKDSKKLMLHTKVTNPEVATFQSFSKGVYASESQILYKKSRLNCVITSHQTRRSIQFLFLHRLELPLT